MTAPRTGRTPRWTSDQALLVSRARSRLERRKCPPGLLEAASEIAKAAGVGRWSVYWHLRLHGYLRARRAPAKPLTANERVRLEAGARRLDRRGATLPEAARELAGMLGRPVSMVRAALRESAARGLIALERGGPGRRWTAAEDARLAQEAKLAEQAGMSLHARLDRIARLVGDFRRSEDAIVKRMRDIGLDHFVRWTPADTKRLKAAFLERVRGGLTSVRARVETARQFGLSLSSAGRRLQDGGVRFTKGPTRWTQAIDDRIRNAVAASADRSELDSRLSVIAAEVDATLVNVHRRRWLLGLEIAHLASRRDRVATERWPARKPLAKEPAAARAAARSRDLEEALLAHLRLQAAANDKAPFSIAAACSAVDASRAAVRKALSALVEAERVVVQTAKPVFGSWYRFIPV